MKQKKKTIVRRETRQERDARIWQSGFDAGRREGMKEIRTMMAEALGLECESGSSSNRQDI